MIPKSSKNISTINFPTVFLKSDSTPAQSKYLADLKKELERHTQSGETNLTIVCLKNVPNIVSFSTSKRSREEEFSPRPPIKKKKPKSMEKTTRTVVNPTNSNQSTSYSATVKTLGMLGNLQKTPMSYLYYVLVNLGYNIK
ncbi:hypothetical protein JTB14_028107 [Gonioctena quinquepunctata]|nr:hypothetical protein JTB14_028107 [Gonioctena quinquepunctata]